MHLLRERDFRLMLLATGLSAFGDELALIALTIKVADLEGTGIAVSALIVAGLLPFVLAAPVAGVLVDRHETTRILAVVSLAQAALAAALVVVDSFPAILALTFLLGAGAAVTQPALFALVPVVAGEERTTQANAYLETARYVGWVAGPFLAGGLAAGLGTGVALMADAGTFVVLGLAALLLRVRRPGLKRQAGRRRGEARRGFAFLGQDRLLLLAVGILGTTVLFAAIDNVAEVFFARRDLHAGDWGYGALAGVWLAGMVGGASIIAPRIGPDRLAPAVMVAAVGIGVAIAVAAAVPQIMLALAMFFVGGIGNGVETVSMRSLIHHRAPDELRGRVFAAYYGMLMGTQLGASAVGGVLVGAVGARVALLISGVGGAAVGLLGLARFATMPPLARSPVAAEGTG